MRRIRATWIAAVGALAALVGIGALALAQESMTFRPVPAESVAAIVGEARKAASAARRTLPGDRRVRIVVDTTGADIQLPGAGVPEPPEPPEPPSETTAEIVRFGGDVEVSRGQAVQGDVVSFGGDVDVEGIVHGSVTAMGGDVTLRAGSRVDGDVVCMGGTLREEPGSFVRGKRVTAPGSGGGRLLLPMFSMLGTGFKIAGHLVWLLVVLGLTFLIVKLAPGRTQLALDTIREDAGTSFLIGLLIWGLIIPSVIVLAIVIAILCITIIGIPLAAAVALAYVAFLVVAFLWGAVVGYALLGGHLHLKFRGAAATLLTSAVWGLVALHGLRIVADLFHIVPLFGFLGGLIGVLVRATMLVLATLGAGALVRAEYRRRTVQNWWQQSRLRGGARKEDDYPPPPQGPAPQPGVAVPPPPTA